MIKAVLFDLDGVLLDSEYRTLMIKKQMFDEFGLPYGEDIFSRIAGSKLADLFRNIWPDYSKADEFLNEYHHRAYDNLCYKPLEMKDATYVLNHLKSLGYKLALVTASDKEKIHQVLSDLTWFSMFDVIISSEDGYAKKPDSACYLAAMEKLEVKAEQCVIVEDSQTGLQAAKGSNAKVICRKESRYPVNQQNADYYIDDLKEILDILKELD